jgi:H+/Cl- antiporter ClcA
MEMTDEHAVVLPLLIGAVLAQLVAKRIMEVPLYRQLAERMAKPEPA